MSVEAAKWGSALSALGWSVRTVAGAGPVDVVVPGLGIDAASSPPSAGSVRAALEGVDVVIVENLLSLPMNLPAATVVASVLRGRPAVLHHHDLPWQRDRYRSVVGFPPDDPAWVHVTINSLSARSLAARGVSAVVVPNAFDPSPVLGDRAAVRSSLSVADDELLVLQPTRALARKGLPVGLSLARTLGATYWLTGPAEEGYGPTAARLLSSASASWGLRTLWQPVPSVADAYAACDVVVFPSTWEGFGNPTIESALHRRPLALSWYPVAAELAAHGFRWFSASSAPSVAALAEWLRSPVSSPSLALLDHNQAVAREHFSLSALRSRLASVLARWGS